MSSRVLVPGDPTYPTLLLDLVATDRSGARVPPPPIYVRGEIPDVPSVAVVGTRDASEGALTFARELARCLAREGVCVWSGGALGVDSAAHEGALEGGGLTVAVMGGGLSFLYPRENIPLFDRIVAAGGAIAARVADDVNPLPARFLQRNVVIAAATRVTVLIEAGVKSGARSTAAAARRLGRPLLVAPGACWDKRGAGCALELANGARAITGAADVLKALGVTPKTAPRSMLARAGNAGVRERSKARPPSSGSVEVHVHLDASKSDASIDQTLSSDHKVGLSAWARAPERAVLDALSAEPTHLDEVCDKAALPLQEVAGVLLTLTLEAVVVEGPAGFYRRVLR